jgi:hypothetical protein
VLSDREDVLAAWRARPAARHSREQGCAGVSAERR